MMNLCSKCKKKQEEVQELIIKEYIGRAMLGDENAKVKLAMMMSKNGKWKNPEILEPKKDIKRKTCKHCGGTGWIEIQSIKKLEGLLEERKG